MAAVKRECEIFSNHSRTYRHRQCNVAGSRVKDLNGLLKHIDFGSVRQKSAQFILRIVICLLR